MPTAAEPPSVPVSFSNNFWGKEDAGVPPLLERLHNSKATCDELKAFYISRAAIEDEYARKMLSLSRRSLGSGELGTLKLSLEVVRQEVEAMGKEHQKVAMKMKADLEEPLTAFAGQMKERRKYVQSPIEKLLKTKTQQTALVSKCRDRYESESKKVKGYLAQGHMVLGQEERKINAKLEKTKIQVSSTSNEYDSAIKALEETTLRWNRDWKLACDTFQDLEEERIEFTKSSLWAFTNITSTVCVTDDASWERIRLSLEDCDVQKDIVSFVKTKGTGQEIPDPPKFKDFCRGDVNDSGDDDDEQSSYQTAQFPRAINPAHRTGAASPQPSPLESHNDPNSALAWEMQGSSPNTTPQKPAEVEQPTRARAGSNATSTAGPYGQKKYSNSWADIPQVPHNEYPPEGMTNFCRTGPPSSVAPSSFAPSDLSSQSARPDSRDSTSDYSSPSYVNLAQAKHGAQSQATPTASHKPNIEPDLMPGHTHQDTPSKKSRFWSPFRKPSRPENVYKEPLSANPSPQRPASRNTWGASAARAAGFGRNGNDPGQRDSIFGGNRDVSGDHPVEPGAKFQLNVGNNVFDVDSQPAHQMKHANASQPNLAHRPVSRQQHAAPEPEPSTDDPFDPVAQALEELNRVSSKVSKPRNGADKYYDIPSPGAIPTLLANPVVVAAKRGTPPPSYDSPVSRLGAPPPAHTKSQMMAAQNRYVNQRKKTFDQPSSGHGGHARTQSHVPNGANNIRAASPQPGMRPGSRAGGGGGGAYRPPSSQGFSQSVHGDSYGAATPRSRPNQGAGGYHPPPRTGGNTYGSSPSREHVSPSNSAWQSSSRPGSSRGTPVDSAMMAVSLHRPGVSNDYGGGRPRSNSYIEKFVAMFNYQAQIEEELGFVKGDEFIVRRKQDDGWWEAEIIKGRGVGNFGLVPSNYLSAIPPGR